MAPPYERLRSVLSDLDTGNVSTGLDFLVQQTLEANSPARCYLPDGVSLIRALAAAKGSEVREIQEKLKHKYGKDFSSRRFASDIAETKAELSAVAAFDQPDNLLRGESGKILVGYENCFQYISTDPQWVKAIGYNEFTGGIEIMREPPAPVTQKKGEEVEDVFDTQLARWLERRSGQVFKVDIVNRTVNDIARQNTFNPPKAYLSSLAAWDGTRRISTWLTDYCGADPGSDEKPAPLWFGRMFMISAVARIMQPGCQVDHMLVLEGATGTGKTSLVRNLVPNPKWFARVREMSGKDASMEIRGAWILEIPELDALSRVDEKTAKKFIDEQSERFRPPYGRRLITVPRQCVFIGTTERDDWMHAETGRRFWPVKCTEIDIDGVKRDRDQLWAEALAAYKAGERWHPDKEQAVEATKEQRKRRKEDAWQVDALVAAKKIYEDREMVESVAYVHIPEVLAKLEVSRDRMKDGDCERVGKILRGAGWIKFQKRLVPGASPSGVYRRPD